MPLKKRRAEIALRYTRTEWLNGRRVPKPVNKPTMPEKSEFDADISSEEMEGKQAEETQWTKDSLIQTELTGDQTLNRRRMEAFFEIRLSGKKGQGSILVEDVQAHLELGNDKKREGVDR
jgi:hypothetical protein